jgi:1-acyl-sn-glycerol-3-phosphate acyltransferase
MAAGPPVRDLTTREKLLLTLRHRRKGVGFWFGLAIELIWPIVMLFTRIGFRGGEHVPVTGGALLAMNHVSSADPIFDTAFVLCHGRIPRYLAKSELWSVPVVRSGGGRGAAQPPLPPPPPGPPPQPGGGV